MTEEATSGDMPEREIDFQGRMLWVRFPAPEKLLVWKRIVVRLQGIQDDDWTADAVMAALERARMIIDSVLVNQADKDWLDDEMLADRLTLREAGSLITQTVEAFAPDDNREAKRAAKKAVRKKTPRKAA